MKSQLGLHAPNARQVRPQLLEILFHPELVVRLERVLERHLATQDILLDRALVQLVLRFVDLVGRATGTIQAAQPGPALYDVLVELAHCLRVLARNR